MVFTNKNRVIENPRVHETLVKAGGATFLMFMLGIIYGEVRQPYFLWTIGFLFFSVAFFVYKASSRATTWIEEIDNKLLAYDPIDVAAYQTLQQVIRERGSTHKDAIAPPIFDWIADERRTIYAILHPEIIKARIAKESEKQPVVVEPRKEYQIKFVKKNITEKKEG